MPYIIWEQLTNSADARLYIRLAESNYLKMGPSTLHFNKLPTWFIYTLECENYHTSWKSVVATVMPLDTEQICVKQTNKQTQVKRRNFIPSLGSLFFWALFAGVCLVHCRIFRNIPGLYSLSNNNTTWLSSVSIKNVSRHCRISPGREGHLQLITTRCQTHGWVHIFQC